MKKKWMPVVFLPWSIIALDQWTKIEIVNRFMLGESVTVIQNYFNLTYVQNLGAAFGMLADTHSSFRIPFFTIIPLFALGVIGYLFRKLSDNDWKMSSALCLVIGGAIGNLIDRIRVGYVIDFLDFHWQHKAHFAAFNIADAAICVGVGILLLDVFAQNPEEQGGQENASHTS